MKQIRNILHSLSRLIHKPIDWFIGRFSIPAGLLLILGSLIFSGCFRHFYSTNSTNQIDSATLVKLVGAQKYFILHDSYKDKEYTLSKIRVAGDSLHADLGEVPDEYVKYQNPAGSNHNAFLVKDKDYVLYEVHLYSEFPLKENVPAAIPLKNIPRIDVYELDKASTNKSKVGSIIGVTLTTAAVTGIIIAIANESKSSPSTPPPNTNVTCSPQVYLTGNNHSELQGTLYSGALYASLERTDYVPLKIINHPAADKVRLSLKGKDAEIIMLNRVQLMQVTCGQKDHVLVDRKGKIQMYHKPVAPEHVITGLNEDVSKEISASDGKYYSFTNHPDGENSSDIILDFKKPRDAATGKLIVNAKNSPWSYYLFSQFKSLYGDYYPTMILKKDHADPKKVLQCELDQYLPLLVSVKYKDGWKMVDYFPTPGTSLTRDLIMNLDLEEFKNSDHVQIRLQTTFMFWDLDYAGMDFSTPDTYQTAMIPVSKEYKNQGECEMKGGVPNDSSGIIINGGEQLNLEFNIPSSPARGLQNSYFLVGNGYYHDFTPFEGKPRFNELSRFNGKGAFDKYSREKYDNLLNVMFDNGKNAMISAK